MQILTIEKWFEAFEYKFKHFESEFEPIERDSKHSNPNSNHSTGIWTIRIQIRPIRQG